MKVSCQKCGARFKIDDSKIPSQGLKMKCPKCSEPISIGAGGGDDVIESDPVSEPDVVSEPDPVKEAENLLGIDSEPDKALEEAPEEDLSFVGDMESETPETPDSFQAEEAFGDMGLDEAAPPESPSDDLDLADDGFALDDALLELDEELRMEGQDSLPPVPDMSEKLPDADVEGLMFDGGEEAVDLSATSSDAQADEPALDMPSLLENAAAELEKELGQDDKTEPGMDAEFPDQGFSFDDMLGDESAAETEAEPDTLDLAGELGLMENEDGGAAGLPDLDETVSEEPLPEIDSAFETDDMEDTRIVQTSDSDLFSQLPDLGMEGGEQVVLYQVRRQSGKVFGPFPENTVIDMVQGGKLQGNEDVSVSGGDWVPLSEMEVFKAVVADAANRSGVLDTFLPDSGDEQKTGKLDQEKKRVLEVSKKRRKAGSLDVVSPLKKRRIVIPKRVALLVAVVAVLVAVAAYFQIVEERSLISIITGRNIADLPYYEQLKSRYRERLDMAYTQMARDNYQGYTQAREICVDLLRVPDFRGAPIVWALKAQIDFQILRRFGGAEEYLEGAKAAMAQLANEKREEPEILFAKAAEAMYEKRFGPAKDLLLKALIAKPKNSKALHLIAEVSLYLPDKNPAKKYLDKVIEANEASARTYYLQGLLHDQLGDVAGARASFCQSTGKRSRALG